MTLRLRMQEPGEHKRHRDPWALILDGVGRSIAFRRTRRAMRYHGKADWSRQQPISKIMYPEYYCQRRVSVMRTS